MLRHWSVRRSFGSYLALEADAGHLPPKALGFEGRTCAEYTHMGIPAIPPVHAAQQLPNTVRGCGDEELIAHLHATRGKTHSSSTNEKRHIACGFCH